MSVDVYKPYPAPTAEFPFVVSVLEDGEQLSSWWLNISENIFYTAKLRNISWIEYRHEILLEHNCVNGAGYDVYFRSEEDYLVVLLKWS